MQQERWMPALETLPEPGNGFRSALRHLWRPSRKPKTPRAARSVKPLYLWAWRLPDREHPSVLRARGTVKAKTRVDARSEIKHALGIAIKRRLPAGIVIEKVEVT